VDDTDTEYESVRVWAKRVCEMLTRHAPNGLQSNAVDAIARLNAAMDLQGEKFRQRRRELADARAETACIRERETVLRKLLAPAGAPHRFVAVVGACDYRVNFTRLIRVLGPFETAELAKAAGHAECERHQPDNARDDETSIEFEVVAWQEVRRG
jgi:hypothetical protein